VSVEWIDHYISTNKKAGGELYRHLRCQKKRRKRYGSVDKPGRIKNRVSIDESGREENTLHPDWV